MSKVAGEADAEQAAAKEEADKAAADAKAAAEKAEAEEVWDEARAKKTIKAQRESEEKALKKAAALQAKLDEYKTAEEAEAEAEKESAVKIAEGQAREQALEKQIADLHIKQDFKARAVDEQGIADPELAYLAAKEQGLLGEYDPKEGKIGEHDFEALGEKYPSFKGSGVNQTGDAGARSKGKAMTTGDQFNRAIRSRI